MVSRQYLESLAPQADRQFGDEVLKQYLRILSEAPEELFSELTMEQQTQRAILLLKAYDGSKGHAQKDVSVDVVDVSEEGVILAFADLRDGAMVIVPLPLPVARQFALQLLMRIHQASEVPEEEEEIGEVKQSVN
jgi:hypothetical protein